LSIPHANGVKALAMGGAYHSIGGDINSLFWNPAGLASVEGLSFSISGDQSNKMWRENQVYRPSRQFVSLSFILDGMLIPDPANNGQLDSDLFWEDSNYVVNDPVLGEDHFSEKAADWQKDGQSSSINSIAIGLPLPLFGKNLYIAGAYNKKYQVMDYDRNHTYLVPHVGYFYYDGLIDRITEEADSLRLFWADYERERSGILWDITGAMALELNDYISLGLGLEMISGETEDSGSLNRVGYFDLRDAQELAFSYDTLNTSQAGTSQFSAVSLNLSALINYSKLSVGLKVNPGYTVKREFEYTVESDTAETSALIGTDEMKIPLGYALGISVQPTETFRLAIDFTTTKYSENEFLFAEEDSLFRGWSDQLILGLGFEYKPLPWLSLLGGYRALPESFIPDGAAIMDRGPLAESFTTGLSVETFIGTFDIAYEMRKFNYYDSYFSNTNFVLETIDNIAVGYRFQF